MLAYGSLLIFVYGVGFPPTILQLRQLLHFLIIILLHTFDADFVQLLLKSKFIGN
jgi:hypothetical protein